MELARISAGAQGTDQDVWARAVVQSIVGKGGMLARKTAGVAEAESPLSADDVAVNLEVSPHWDDADYEMYAGIFGARAPLVLYSAMFKTPLPGTEADVASHFGDRAQRLRGFNLFMAMVQNLIPPVVACGPPRPESDDNDDGPVTLVLPPTPVATSSHLGDAVGEVIRALGLPSLVDRKKLAALLLTYYLPNTAVGVRTYLESQLRLNAVQAPLLEAWVAAHPTLSNETWSVLAKDAQDFQGLPAQLDAWFPLEVPFRARIALAMTQNNDMELMGALLPAMGVLMARRVRAARTEIRAACPDLGEWLAGIACQ